MWRCSPSSTAPCRCCWCAAATSRTRATGRCPAGCCEADETLEQAAVRELREETGVIDVYMEQLATFSKVDRDPRGRVISCCYLALVDGHPGALAARLGRPRGGLASRSSS